MGSRHEEIEGGWEGGRVGNREGGGSMRVRTQGREKKVRDGKMDEWKERVSERIRKGVVEELRDCAMMGSRNEEREGGSVRVKARGREAKRNGGMD